jgi:hypothetical protein
MFLLTGANPHLRLCWLQNNPVNTQKMLPILPSEVVAIVEVFHDRLAKVSVVLKFQLVCKSKAGIRKYSRLGRPPVSKFKP